MKKLLSLATLALVALPFSVVLSGAKNLGANPSPIAASTPTTSESPVPSSQSLSEADFVVFERDGCTHCEDLKAWAEARGITDQILFLNINDGAEGERLYGEITSREGFARVTPITFLGGKFFVGFDQAETTGKFFESLLTQGLTPGLMEGGQTLGAYLDADAKAGTHGAGAAICDEDGDSTECIVPASPKVRIPWTDITFDPGKYSLPVMAGVLGFIDGFNPCAMWVLVTFLIILAELGERRKMVLAAGLFLVAEAVMYFMILNGWSLALTAVNALSELAGPAIGVVAVGAGIFFLWEAITVPAGECKVVNPTRRASIVRQIKGVLSQPIGLASAVGIVGIALSVNVIEFVCSVGIPQTYAQILELNGVSMVVRQALNVLYTAMYMVDDVIVFAIAVVSFGTLAETSGKYAKVAQWIGGGLMVILGGLLIFAPEVLRF